ncbi:MAG: glycosyltransferase family 2 protein [Acidimicrobiales bacterium]
MTDPPRVDVGISIASDNNREGLARCLRSVPPAAGEVAYQIHVVLNASTDGSAEMLAADFPEVTTHINGQRRGFAHNHNLVLRGAVAAGRPPYTLVLNDDTELGAGSLDRLVRAMAGQPRTGAMAPRVVGADGAEAAVRLARPTARSSWRYDWRGVGELADPDDGWLQGCCLLLRTAALSAVGPFDEQFFLFYEDADLSRRLHEAGWALAVNPDACIVHVGHQTVLRPELAGFTPMQGLRSRYLYFAKHLGPRRSLLISWVGRALLVARAVKLLYRGSRAGAGDQWRQGRAKLRLAGYDPRRPLVLPPSPPRR